MVEVEGGWKVFNQLMQKMGVYFFVLYFSQLLSDVATVATSFKALAESHWSLVSNAHIGLIVSITNHDEI